MTLRFALLALTAGCIHTIPPVATPGPAEPPRAPGPIAPGRGWVFVDVVDGPTEVSVVTPVDNSVGEDDLVWLETEPLETQSRCTSPCVLNLPLGRHVLAFPKRGSGSVELAHVIASPSPTVYRHALGLRTRGSAGFVLGVLSAIFGGASFATGAALLPIGLAKDSHGMTVAGGITVGAGALLTAVGIWAIANNPSTEQAGAGAQYGLPDGER